jgi:hypothetical protein
MNEHGTWTARAFSATRGGGEETGGGLLRSAAQCAEGLSLQLAGARGGERSVRCALGRAGCGRLAERRAVLRRPNVSSVAITENPGEDSTPVMTRALNLIAHLASKEAGVRQRGARSSRPRSAGWPSPLGRARMPRPSRAAPAAGQQVRRVRDGRIDLPGEDQRIFDRAQRGSCSNPPGGPHRRRPTRPSAEPARHRPAGGGRRVGALRLAALLLALLAAAGGVGFRLYGDSLMQVRHAVRGLAWGDQWPVGAAGRSRRGVATLGVGGGGVWGQWGTAQSPCIRPPTR